MRQRANSWQPLALSLKNADDGETSHVCRLRPPDDLGEGETQPTPPDDVEEIMQAFLERSRQDYADVVEDNGGDNLLEINDSGLLAQVFTNQGPDVDYLTGELRTCQL